MEATESLLKILQQNWMNFPSKRRSGAGDQHSYLILLRELQIVVCLEALNVICQLRDGDGRVTGHACRAQKNTSRVDTGTTQLNSFGGKC